MSNRGKPGPGYLAEGITAADLAALDAIYALWESGKSEEKRKPVIFSRVGPEKWAVYWGEGSSSGLTALGYRGKLWALSLILVHYARLSPKPRAIAHAIVQHVKAYDPAFVEHPLVRNANGSLEDVYTVLISETQKESCPDTLLASVLLEFAVELCVQKLFQSASLAEIGAFRRAAKAGSSSIGSYFFGLTAVLPPGEIADRALVERPNGEWVADVTRIDPVLSKGIEDDRSVGRNYLIATPDDHADTLARQLASELRENALLFVHGEPFVGKKGHIKAFLRCLAHETDRLSFTITGEIDARVIQRLPVRMISAQNVPFRHLVDQVVQFLQDYHVRSQAAARTQSATVLGPLPPLPRERDIDGILRWISDNCRHLPALYVFADTDAFRFDHARNAVRDNSIIKLLRTLNRTNRFTRVIVTTFPLPASGKERKALFGTLRHRALPVPPRSAEQLRKMLSKDLRGGFPNDLTADPGLSIRGDDLIAVATVFNLGKDNSTSSIPFHVETDRLAREFLTLPTDARDDARAKLYGLLARLIEAHGLLHPIALIAACEDGLQTSTLIDLLTRWSRHDPALKPPRSSEALESSLRDFWRRSGNAFLNLVPMPHFDREEFDFLERPDPRSRLWEIETMVSLALLRAIRKEHREMVLSAHRLIAGAARGRAQLKKVFMRAPFGTRASDDVSRDVQAYVNLLASIPRDLTAAGRISQPMRLSETVVFSVNPKAFDPALALRFAVLSLLKEDIDHDHRLSMIYDEDALRLDMYLLLFQPLGEIHTNTFIPPELPDSLPDHLVSGIFTEGEVIDLLTTVALSAFHAQRFATVENVAKLATGYIMGLELPDAAEKLSRIWCCQLDARILLGGTVEDATGHRSTLALVDSLLREHFPNVSLPVASADPNSPETISGKDKAYMRLLARKADLVWLCQSRAAAAQLYETLELWESAFAFGVGRHDPIVLSGRMARRYIRFLLLDPLTSSHMPSDDLEEQRRAILLAKANGLLSVNISRLRRFSGADRVGVMLDLARLNAAMQQYGKACQYADAADRRAYAGNVSDAGRMDVLIVLADVHLCAISQGLRLGSRRLLPDRLLRTVREALDELQSIVDGRDYRPARGTMLWLRARLALADFRIAEKRDYASYRRAASLDKAFDFARRSRGELTAVHDHSLDERISALLACLESERSALDIE